MRKTILLVPLFSLCPLFPWGSEGHHIVARVAERHLTAQARQKIAGLLEAGETFVSVSTWADDVRNDRRESGPWHYINIPMKAKRGPLEVYCPPESCITAKIRDFLAVLKNAEAGRAQRAEALKFVIHFVGDFHQPLHCIGEDKGGNARKIVYSGSETNLHSAWDRAIVERITPDEQAFAAMIDAGSHGGWAKGKMEDWAWDNVKLARKVAYGKLPEGDVPQVGDKYLKKAAGVVREQLEKAGLRLARLLNEVL